MTDDTDRNRELLSAYTAWAQTLADALPGETTLTIRQYPIGSHWHNRDPKAPTAYTIATLAISTGSTLTLQWNSTNTVGFVLIRSEFRIDGGDHDYHGASIPIPSGMDPVTAAEIVETTVLGHNRAAAAFFARLRAEEAGFADKRKTELAPLIDTGTVTPDDDTLRLGWNTVLRSTDRDVKVTASGTDDVVSVRLRNLTQQQAAVLLTAYRAATVPRATEQIAA